MLRSLYWKITAPVAIIAAIGTMLIALSTPYLLEWYVTRTAVDGAEQLIETVRGIRNYYSANVVEKVTRGDQFHVTAVHGQQSDGIPVPATFVMEMMDYGQRHTVITDLVSPYPFTNRAQRQMDAFQQRAWQAILNDPSQYYVELVKDEGRSSVRLAQADLLNAQACVDCHNAHPDSPRTDWQLGDVRGLLEVNTRVDALLERGLWISRALMVIAVLTFALIMLVNIRAARRVSGPLASITDALRQLSLGRTPEAVSASSAYLEVEALADAFESFSEKESQRKQLAEQVTQLAYFDSLTGLANRTRFQQYVDELLSTRDNLAGVCIVQLDVDNFSDINDTLGYDAGDQVLGQLAQRIAQVAPEGVLVARLGEDAFALAIKWLERDTPPDLALLLTQLHVHIAEPLYVAERQLQLTVSIGSACVKKGEASAEGLMLQANVALSRAKLDGRDRTVMHTPQLSAAVSERVEMVRALSLAVQQHEFIPYYQPQFDLRSGRLLGAEALMRWRRRDGQLMAPDQFIPLAEQSRLIVPMGAQILKQACEDCLRWQLLGLEQVGVAVNVSSVQFAEDDLVQLTRNTLRQTGLDPALLELEVTESATLADLDKVVATLSQLRELGIELALDDFGTGYSSLSYLKILPVDRLKIDRAFVRDLLSSPDDQAILTLIVGLGEALGLRILAEGVEDEAQLNLLRNSGCLEVQGFYYARPLPFAEFVAFANRYRSRWQAQQPLAPAGSSIQ